MPLFVGHPGAIVKPRRPPSRGRAPGRSGDEGEPAVHGIASPQAGVIISPAFTVRAHPARSTPVTFEGAEGLALVGEAYGDPSAQPVILLHGGGQTRHAWGGTAAALASAGYHALALDGRGHGESAWSATGSYLIDHFITDLKAVAATVSARPVVVGASLGGLTALLAEGESPGFASAVVLVDIATTSQMKGIRRIVDFMSQRPEGYASLEEVADVIAAYQPQRKRPPSLEGLAKNVRKGADGRYRWHWDPLFLTHSTPENSVLRPDRLRAAARALRVPTLLVRGKLSDVVGEEDVQHFRELVPHAEYVDVRDAGHMIAGDSNDVFTQAVVGFLDSALGPR
jgi:pimeloyl-ACP methyl ester carboxylesterase